MAASAHLVRLCDSSSVFRPDPDAPPAPPALKLLDAHQVLPLGVQPSGNHLIIGQEEEDDPQMAAFLPMLRDYLSSAPAVLVRLDVSSPA